MFDRIYDEFQAGTAAAGTPGWGTDGLNWSGKGAMRYSGYGENERSEYLNPQDTSGLEDLYRQAGYTGPMIMGNEGGSDNYHAQHPALTQWLAQNGNRVGFAQDAQGTGDATQRAAQIFDAAGNPLSDRRNWQDDPDNAFGLAMLAAGGVLGGASAGLFSPAAGAGAGSIGGGAGAGAGFESLGVGSLGTAGYGGVGEAAAGIGGMGGGAGAGAGFESLGVGSLGTAGAGAGGVGGAGGAAGGAGGWGGLLDKAGGYLMSPGGIGTIAQLAGGAMSANAAKDAAEAQIASTRDANALAKYMYDQNRADNMPALTARNNALGGLQGLLANPNSIVDDPGYQFGQQQGQQALDRRAAAKGGLYSGAQMKAASRFNSDYAGTKLDQTYNRLAGIAGAGQVGAGQIGQAGQNYANTYGQNVIGAGNAAASGTVGSANAWNNALSGAYNSYQQNQLMDYFMKNRGG